MVYDRDRERRNDAVYAEHKRAVAANCRGNQVQSSRNRIERKSTAPNNQLKACCRYWLL